jgi:hypothetical protein
MFKKGLIGMLLIAILGIPLAQTASADAFSGSSSTGRYLNFNLYKSDGVTPLPVTSGLPVGIDISSTSNTINISGQYEVDNLLGKNAEIRYKVFSSTEVLADNLISALTVDPANKTGNINKNITLTKGSGTDPNTVYFPDGNANYQIAAYVVYDMATSNQIYSQLARSFRIQSNQTETYKNVVTDTSVVATNANFDVTIKDDTAVSLKDRQFLYTDLTNKVNFNIDGFVDLSNNTGDKVAIRYDIMDNKSINNTNNGEGLINLYTQTDYTKNNYVKFNKAFSIKVAQAGEIASSTLPINLLPSEDHSYVARISVLINNNVWKIQDFPFHVGPSILNPADYKARAQFNPTLNNDISGLASQLVNGKGLLYNLTRSNTDFSTVTLADLRAGTVDVDLQGMFGDKLLMYPDVLIKYDIATRDSSKYIESNEGILKKFTQTSYTQQAPVEFNRTLRFTTKDPTTLRGSTEYKPIIQLHDYPSIYSFNVVALYRNSSADDYRVYDQVTKSIAVTGADTDKSTFDDGKNGNVVVIPKDSKTNLDIEMNTYGTGTTLNPFITANAADIKTTPLKVNIRGLLKANTAPGTNLLIRYQVTSFDDYSKLSFANQLVKRYTQSSYTMNNGLEFNRDIYLSTNTRSPIAMSTDNKESTIYLEDKKQNYTVRITVINADNSNVIISRDLLFLVDGSGVSQQPIVGPNETLPSGLSGFVAKQDGSLANTYEITARDLNKADNSNGIDIDLTGFIKTPWTTGNVKIGYTLTDTNFYTDYTKDSNGVQTSLQTDPDNPQEPSASTLVDPMTTWFGQPNQTGFLKQYTATQYTSNNHENFARKLNLRTKLRKSDNTLSNNTSVLFLDNIARNYELTLTATNQATGEILTNVVHLNITTVTADVEAAPIFSSSVGVTQPRRGTGYFMDDSIPLGWIKANDADNEMLYYKVYYYYATLDANGQANSSIQKWMLRHDDFPTSGSSLSDQYILTAANKIEPVYVRIYACDINHICSSFTRTNPFKFNNFGNSETGSGGGSGSAVAIPATVRISPTPTGKWSTTSIPLIATFDGDASLAVGAIKRYEITHSADFPQALTKTMGSDNAITVSGNGTWYVHVTYTLSSDTNISTTQGPYMIDDSVPTGAFMSLKKSDGQVADSWVKGNATLTMTPPGGTPISNNKLQYRLDGIDSGWQDYSSPVIINTEGNYLIYGRVTTGAGIPSTQSFIRAQIDNTSPSITSLVLEKDDLNKYSVIVNTTDGLSGISSVKTDTNVVLTKSGVSNSYTTQGMSTKPTSITITDVAGNVNTTSFASEPTITMPSGYNPSSTTRQDVSVTVGGSNVVSYKLGNITTSCASSTCIAILSGNSILTVTNTEGYKATRWIQTVQNIDKSEIKLMLVGGRSATDGTIINLNWNISIANAILSCSGNPDVSINGLNYTITAAQNRTYDCKITAVIDGKTIASNIATIYPDYTKAVDQANIVGGIDITGVNVFVEDDRLGTTYYINTKRKTPGANPSAKIPGELFK